MESDEAMIKRQQGEKEKLRSALLLLLDQVDYTNGACAPTELVGAVLPEAVIDTAHAVLKSIM